MKTNPALYVQIEESACDMLDALRIERLAVVLTARSLELADQLNRRNLNEEDEAWAVEWFQQCFYAVLSEYGTATPASEADQERLFDAIVSRFEDGDAMKAYAACLARCAGQDRSTN